jgi:O-antigen/teichoic acid export membrane protein
MNQPLNIFVQLLTIVGLLLVVLFCAFGFLACFELNSPLARLPWQLLYLGGLVLSSLTILRKVRRVLESV